MAKFVYKLFKHIKCRNCSYPRSEVTRFGVPDELVDWDCEFEGYDPIYYDSDVIKGKSWADPEITTTNFLPKFNDLDGAVNRRSHCGEYLIQDPGYPLNPYGRTGLRGRGVLGRWGPNHAADPIVSRWKRNGNGAVLCDRDSGLGILQMCIIKRGDCGEYALPGGMVDPGETISQTLKREFTEEALNSDNSAEAQELIDKFFSPSNDVEMYRNYVDDPRNTDNAWMETVAVNFHDETGESVGRFQLCAGDDAAHVQWMDINRSVKFYASHQMLIEAVAKRLNAHW